MWLEITLKCTEQLCLWESHLILIILNVKEMGRSHFTWCMLWLTKVSCCAFSFRWWHIVNPTKILHHDHDTQWSGVLLTKDMSCHASNWIPSRLADRTNWKSYNTFVYLKISFLISNSICNSIASRHTELEVKTIKILEQSLFQWNVASFNLI